MEEPTHVQHALAAARRKHERWIALCVMVACAAGMVSVMRVVELSQLAVGRLGLALVVVTVAYYAGVVAWTFKRPVGDAARVFHTTMEPVVVTVFVWLWSSISPEFALGLDTPFIYPLGVAVTVLRLEPWLCMYAGIWSAVLQVGTYLLLIPGGETEAPTLAPTFMAARVLYVVVGGGVGMMGARSMRRMVLEAAEEAGKRAHVRAAFGTYVANQVVERVLSGDLVPVTERRVLTVMFVDIRGFTRMSESMDPAQVLERLNLALEAFSLRVQAHGGIVNKYLGDGLMAIFGAPELLPDHADQAVHSALEIVREARLLRESGAFPGLHIGVGIHSGDVVVGDIGGRGHREYTAIGDVVNVASRVEAANKDAGTTILLTAGTQALMRTSVAMEELPPLTLRNREETVRVFSVVG